MLDRAVALLGDWYSLRYRRPLERVYPELYRFSPRHSTQVWLKDGPLLQRMMRLLHMAHGPIGASTQLDVLYEIALEEPTWNTMDFDLLNPRLPSSGAQYIARETWRAMKKHNMPGLCRRLKRPLSWAHNQLWIYDTDPRLGLRVTVVTPCGRIPAS